MPQAATPVQRTPDGHPLVGHLLAFRRDRLELLDACVAAPGDVIELRIRTPAYLLKRAEDVRHVFVTAQAAYVKDKRNIGARATRIFGDGLMTSTGERHLRMRRRVQPAFRRESLAPLAEVVVRGVDAMVERWEQGPERHLADEMTGFALQTLMDSIFGVESGHVSRVLEEGVIARRDSMTRGLASLTPLPAFLPLAVRRRRRRAIKGLDEAIERLIRVRREQAVPGDDLLSMVMDSHDGGLSASDPRQARDQALTLALAAYENIARALTWTFLALARRPDVEAKVRAEVKQVLGDRAPAADDAASLHYTEMTVAESMRLWPPTPLVSRIARQDDVLPTGARIRAGSKILLSPYVVQRNSDYYPDPERFLPERFGEEGRRDRPRYAYFPFGGGPRICIGQPLAMLTCTLVLAHVAQRGRLELLDEPADYMCGCLPPGFGPRVRLRSVA